MSSGQYIGLAIFWVAGATVIYFWLRDTDLSVWANLRELWWMLLLGGAVAGFMIYALALATTH